MVPFTFYNGFITCARARCHQRRQSLFISHSSWRGRAQNVSRLKPGMSRPVMSSLAGAAGAVLRSQMLQKNFDKKNVGVESRKSSLFANGLVKAETIQECWSMLKHCHLCFPSWLQLPNPGSGKRQTLSELFLQLGHEILHNGLSNPYDANGNSFKNGHW